MITATWFGNPCDDFRFPLRDCDLPPGAPSKRGGEAETSLPKIGACSGGQTFDLNEDEEGVVDSLLAAATSTCICGQR